MAGPAAPAPRVRFAPAPTGSLHVGGVRTALFNWLYARHTGGAFLLRIEDTDRERSRVEHTEAIVDTMRWLGLDWDEGPYHQGERWDLYHAAVAQLLADGHAYESWLTEAELAAERETAVAAGRRPRFRELAATVGPGGDRTRTVWFAVPEEGASTFTDLVRGEVRVEWATVSDFMIVRSSGAPVFYIANAVDDADMGITHVIRGEDLLDSTHRVLALRAALGHADPPVYAHLPLLVGADRAKLSKRHGAVGIDDFRGRGYLPEAIVNYLALLGFPAEEGREIRPLAELVAEFDLSRVHHAAAMFDHQKLDWIDQEYIKALPPEELAARARPFAEARFGDRFDPVAFERLVPAARQRAVTLDDAAERTGFLFVPDDEFAIADDAWAALVAVERVDAVLEAAASQLSSCPWTLEGVDVRAAIEALGLKARKAMPALYVAIEGQPSGLPLFDAILALGRARALTRLRAARDRLASSAVHEGRGP
jgi:glutamyl-tRNA synthetase